MYRTGVRGRRTRRVATLVAVAATTLLTASVVEGASAGAAPAGHLTATGISGGTTIDGAKSFTSRLAKSDPAVLKLSGSKPVSVMVKLDYDALGSYTGDIRGYAATSPQVTKKKLNAKSPAAVAYTNYITSRESAFTGALKSAIPAASVRRAYRTVYGGVSVTLPADKVSALLSLPNVSAVQADALHKLDAATVNDDDASFIGGQVAYDALGSSSTAGQGVIVADIDTGVWPEHPSFAARPDLPASPPPTSDGHARACNFGKNPLTNVTFACNNKLIEGQVFLDSYNLGNHDELYPTTARDSNGHGTHTTSTAGGNPLQHATLFGVDRGPIQGIAPGAFLMSYKALGPLGGYDSDLVAAIEQAVLDGANVINYSIGPSTPQSAYTSSDDLAFLDAFDAGVFVSASAGNSGPGAQTTSHLGPWETTVGATTLQRAFRSAATLSAPGAPALQLTGDSIMPGISAPTPVVNANSVAGEDNVCSKPAPAGSFTGKIVVCVRGGVDSNGDPVGRVQKGYNVKQGGAVGMFLINPVPEDTETDNHFLPAVHFDAPAGNQLEAYLAAHPGTVATFTEGQKANAQGDVMAAFSSRGPGGDFLKPDIAAPGVQILAGNTPTPTDVASGPSGQYFQAIAGTSMAAPHITGSAALVLALHPGLSPAEVKSVLMTTANRNVKKEDTTTPATPFDDGAGRVDLAGVVDPGLVLNVTKAEMDAVLTDPLHRIDLNEPSVYDQHLPGRVTTTRKIKNIDSRPEVYKITATSDLPGGVTVSPSIVNVPPNSTATVTITLDGSNGTVGHWYFGQIDLTQVGSGSHHLHLPVAFSPADASAVAQPVSLTSNCAPTTIRRVSQTTTCTASVQNSALQPANVSVTMNSVDTKLQLLSNSAGGVRNGSGVTFNTTLAAATAPTPNVQPGESPAGFLGLSLFGIPVQPLGDESITNFTLQKPFMYDGVQYSRIGVASDGYLVVGGGQVPEDLNFDPQTFPNPVRPNNVLAPLWTDLDGRNGTVSGLGLRIGNLTDGVNSWLVVEWNAYVYGTTQQENFQVWIGQNSTQDISYTYNPGHYSAPTNIAYNVGAENDTGTAGNNVALPAPGTDLVVTSTPGAPGGSATFSATFRGVQTGTGYVETDMTSSITRDTSVKKVPITVTP
jgi:subtilisin family serine protease